MTGYGKGAYRDSVTLGATMGGPKGLRDPMGWVGGWGGSRRHQDGQAHKQHAYPHVTNGVGANLGCRVAGSTGVMTPPPSRWHTWEWDAAVPVCVCGAHSAWECVTRVFWWVGGGQKTPQSNNIHHQPTSRHGLCSDPAHLWATSDFVPRSSALGTPQAAGVM